MSTLRARRRKRTADTIRKAAVELALSDGLDNITTEMIAERAGISLRSFFNYFAFKEEALLPPPVALSDEKVEQFVNGSGPLLDDLADLLVAHFRQTEINRTQLRALLELSRTHPKLMFVKDQTFCRYEDQMGVVIARRLSVGPEDPRPRLMAATVAAAIRVGVSRWVAEGQGQIEDEVLSTVTALRDLFQERTPGTPRLRRL